MILQKKELALFNYYNSLFKKLLVIKFDRDCVELKLDSITKILIEKKAHKTGYKKK